MSVVTFGYPWDKKQPAVVVKSKEYYQARYPNAEEFKPKPKQPKKSDERGSWMYNPIF